MQLGDLKRRVSIEKPTYTADGNGQEVISWSAIGSYWAKLSYENGIETTEDEQRVARRVVKFTIRFDGDIDETYRLVYDSKYYYITGIERIHRKRYLILKCFYADR